MSRAHHTARTKIEIENRRRLVAANLLAGASYRDIARQLNVSPATIAADYRAILNQWKEAYSEKLDKYIYIQLRRLDVLLNAIWDDATKGNTSSIDRALSIMDRQTALLQLKYAAPTQTGTIVFNIHSAPRTEAGDRDMPLMIDGGDITTNGSDN
jgi:hypothetical protein